MTLAMTMAQVASTTRIRMVSTSLRTLTSRSIGNSYNGSSIGSSSSTWLGPVNIAAGMISPKTSTAITEMMTASLMIMIMIMMMTIMMTTRVPTNQESRGLAEWVTTPWRLHCTAAALLADSDGCQGGQLA